MITANEAVALYDLSEAKVNTIMSQIDYEICTLAAAGKRIYECQIDGLWDSVLEYTAYDTQKTKVQEDVSKKLAALGYRVHFGRCGPSYVPRGLQDDNFEGPKYVNLGLVVYW